MNFPGLALAILMSEALVSAGTFISNSIIWALGHTSDICNFELARRATSHAAILIAADQVVSIRVTTTIEDSAGSDLGPIYATFDLRARRAG